MSLSKDIYTAYKKYIEMGLDPVPIPYEDGHPSKGPKITDWPIIAANHEFTEADFENASGVGNLLGGPRNLSDIDCDSPEAIRIGMEVMDDLTKKTGKTMAFGRLSKPRSHVIYYTDQSLPSEKINDPADGECIIEYRCVTKDGTRGVQTVFPPSLKILSRRPIEAPMRSL